MTGQQLCIYLRYRFVFYVMFDIGQSMRFDTESQVLGFVRSR